MKTRTSQLGIFLLVNLIGLTGCHGEDQKQINALVKHTLKNMRLINGGTFTMGPTNPNFMAGNNLPAHQVKLTSFYMDRFNVSYGEYDHYTQINGMSYIQKNYMIEKTGKWIFFRNKRHPVSDITWGQAANYCQWLRQVTGLPFSLPTEAQWAYAARNRGKENWYYATNNGKLAIGKNYPSMRQYANQKGNISGGSIALPIGSIPCNPLGLCGMAGQVNQWVKDWYSPTYYAHSSKLNPQGPKTGTKKIVRGGGAAGDAVFNNNFGRSGISPKRHWAGFRCVINSDKPLNQLRSFAMKHIKQTA